MQFSRFVVYDLSVTDLLRPETVPWKTINFLASLMDSLPMFPVIFLMLYLALIALALALTLPQSVLEIQNSKPNPEQAVTMSPHYVPMKYQTCSKPEHKPTANHSSLPASLLQYQVYLRDVYHRYNYSNCKYSKQSDFLAKNRPEHPINLVLLHKEEQNDTSHNERVKLVFRDGMVDKIQNQKTAIQIEEIGSTLMGNAAAHFVLIEGAAGVGKSTLSWQLCRLWSEGKLQHEWDLVVLVQLRDETTRKATSVYDLLYHPNYKIRKLLAQEIQKREGKGLMVIFDGYDELSDDQRSEFSLVQRILSNQILEKATIVVTSRPMAMKSLPNQFIQTLDKHIEIVGFNETDIHTYITLACKDNIKLSQSLRSYISSRPFILSVMYNPLHCTIVTELYIQYWQYGHQDFAPNTLTELYTALVLNHLRPSLPLNQSSNIEKLTDLPPHMYNDLMKLAELAATGLLTGQYIYNNLPCDAHGLMVSVRQLYDLRPNKKAYTFLHLTLQEFLSAFYLNHRIQQQKNSTYKSMQSMPSFSELLLLTASVYYDSFIHWPFLLFLAGFTKHGPYPFQQLPKEYLSETNSMVIGPLCQLLFESQSPQTVSDMFSHMKISPLLSATFDWFAIGYCIANSNNKSSWNIKFLNSPQQLQLLSRGLHYSKNNINLNLSGLTINMSITFSKLASPAKFSTLFSTLYPFTKAISHLSLSMYNNGSYPDDECCFHALQNLSYYCPNLKSLSLSMQYRSFVSKKPLDIPKETMVTIRLTLLRHSVLLDSLPQYQSLSELYLYNTDR